MVHCFIDFLKCIFCCEDEPYNDPDGYRYQDHDNSYIRIQDQRNSHKNLFSRIGESAISSGSNFTTKIPAKASVLPSTSTNPYQVFTPFSDSATSSISRGQAPSPKPPPFTPSGTSSSLKPPQPQVVYSTPKSTEPPRPRVTVLPPPVSSKPTNKSVWKPCYTESPSIPSRERTPSPKPPPFTSSGTSSSSSSKPPPLVSPTSKSKSFPSSSSFDLHEGGSKLVKEILRRVSSEEDKTTYAQQDASSIYTIPKEIQDIIKMDKVPGILRSPLTPLTYKDYFATLLYAEDFYIEKWSEFQLKNVSLPLHEASVLKQNKDRNRDAKDVKDNRIFVTFEIDSVPERRPFFLSRDFVFAKPVGKQDRKFQGIIHRVQKSTHVLVEFEEGFHRQHNSKSKYDISFSFNRVRLKRAHQALEAAVHPSFENFLFPMCSYRSDYSPRSPFSQSSNMLDLDQKSAIRHILGLKGSPPYLVEGPTIQYSELPYSKLSKTGVLVRQAVLEIYRTVKNSRVLVSAPKNSTCDGLTSSLMKDIPESEMFRANAAFREMQEVPVDIFASCRYKNDCFACPPLQKLKKFRVVFSTFVSGFRLHNEGIKAGHFSHIFLVDASSAIEPEVMITLANLANNDTSVIVTGLPSTGSRWVRSDIARRNGLQKSYFKRLRENAPYKTLDSAFITQLQDPDRKSH